MVSISAPEGTTFETLYNSIMNRFLLYFILLVSSGLSSCKGEAPKEAAQAARQAPAAPTVPQKSLPKIIAFGDSLTEGYGLDPAESYPSLLEKKLSDNGYQYEVV